MALFTEGDLKVIRFEDSINSKQALKVNDWKIVSIVYQNASIFSPHLNVYFEISDTNLFELMSISTVENNCLVGFFRPLKFKNKIYLLKEGTAEFIAATNNSEIKKPILKSGEKYKLKANALPNLFNENRFAEVDIDNLNLVYTYLGSFVFTSNTFNFSKKDLDLGHYTSTTHVFLVNNKLVQFSRRNHFTLIEKVGFDSNYEDKDISINNFNKKIFEESKHKFENRSEYFRPAFGELKYIDFNLFFNSEKEFKSLKSNGNIFYLEKLKKLLLS